MERMTTAAIYTRISLDSAGDGLGVARQEQDCRAKATALGWDVGGIYSDNDVSASKDVPRPEYDRLMSDLTAGVVNALIVYDLDRLTRKPAELETFIDLADRHGVALANVSGDVDLTTAAGRMVARIKGAVAKQEAERIGERVRRQKQQRAEQGIPAKGRDRLYGYTRDWELIPDEAAVILDMFTRRAAGESATAIAKSITTTTVAGNQWKAGVVLTTLKKHVYAGKVTWKGEVVADSVVPNIVDWDTFQAAQVQMANKSAGTNARTYLLSGILLCDHCLSPMKGNPSNHMYRCSTTYGGCGRLSVRIALADKWVVWAAHQKASESITVNKVTPNYDGIIAEREKAIAALQEDRRAGAYTLAEVKPLIDSERKAIQEAVKGKATVETMNIATARYFDFAKMNLSQKRAYVNAHITNVVVKPSISQGNQPFNPARLEVHYVDGEVGVIEKPTD